MEEAKKWERLVTARDARELSRNVDGALAHVIDEAPRAQADAEAAVG
jgi:hypothetical protein